MRLPEDGVRLILVMADEIARQHGISTEEDTEAERNTALTRKKKAFQNMLDMRERLTYPKDFDYRKVIEEARAWLSNICDMLTVTGATQEQIKEAIKIQIFMILRIVYRMNVPFM